AALVQTGGTIKPLDYATLHRASKGLFEEDVPEAPGIAENDGCPAKDLPAFLPQAAGYRRVCAPRGRSASDVALSADRACKKSSQQKTAIAASEQSRGAGNESLVFVFRLCRRISNAEKLAASGVQSQNRNG